MFIRPGTDLRRIAGVIWDYDDVLYNVANFPPGAFQALPYETKMLTACRLLPPMTYAEAVTIAQHFVEDGAALGAALDDRERARRLNPINAFLPLAEERGYTPAQFRSEIVRIYHDVLYATVQERYPHVLAPRPELVRAFAAASGVKHGILSHSSIEHWVQPGCASMGLSEFFNEAHCLGLGQLRGAHKAKGPEAVTLALEATGLAAWETAFAEDAEPHLEIAKKEYPELTTVWKVAADWVGEPKDHIDIVICRPEELLNAITAARALTPVAGLRCSF